MVLVAVFDVVVDCFELVGTEHSAGSDSAEEESNFAVKLELQLHMEYYD